MLPRLCPARAAWVVVVAGGGFVRDCGDRDKCGGRGTGHTREGTRTGMGTVEHVGGGDVGSDRAGRSDMFPVAHHNPFCELLGPYRRRYFINPNGWTTVMRMVWKG